MTPLLALLLLAPPAGIPRAALLAEAEPLAAELARPDPPRLLDCRPPAEYAAGHIPGAISLDAEAWAAAFGDGSDIAAWSTRIGELGVGPGTKVVTLDAAKSLRAAHVWWILKYWGVENVRVLDGGMTAWLAAGGAVGAQIVVPRPTLFVARAQRQRFADKAGVLKSLNTATQIVDTRSRGEFDGSEPMGDTRGGAIPGAKHLAWDTLLDPTTHKFLPAALLAKRFADAGITPGGACVTYCQGGVRASVAALALELSGAAPARNYHASWGEWGRDPATPTAHKP